MYILNGVLPSKKIKNDLLNAENLGSQALDIFIYTTVLCLIVGGGSNKMFLGHSLIIIK